MKPSKGLCCMFLLAILEPGKIQKVVMSAHTTNLRLCNSGIVCEHKRCAGLRTFQRKS